MKLAALAVLLATAACGSSKSPAADGGNRIDSGSDVGRDGPDGPRADGPLPLDSILDDAPCTGCTSLTTEWERHFGGPDFVDNFTGAATDSHGNVYASGYFAGTVDFGGGHTLTALQTDPPPAMDSLTSDIVVASYTGAGTVRWVTQVGGTSGDQASSVAVVAGKVYVAASFGGTITVDGETLTAAGDADTLVLVLDAATGAHVAHYHFASADNDFALSVGADAAGNVTICGFFETGVMNFGGGHTITGAADLNAYVVSVTPAGVHRWSRMLAGSAVIPPALGTYNDAQAVVVDRAGNVTVLGDWEGTADFGAGTLTSTAPPQAYRSDTFVASYTAMGVPRWSTSFGNGLGTTAHAMGIDGNGDIVIGGIFHGTQAFGDRSLVQASQSAVNGFAVALDGTTGAPTFARAIADTESSGVRGVQFDSHGDVIVTGECQADSTDFGDGVVVASAAGGEEDTFLAGFARADGHTLFAKRWGGAGSGTFADPADLALTARDDMVIAGQLSGPVDLGDGPVTGATRDAGYVMLVPR